MTEQPMTLPEKNPGHGGEGRPPRLDDYAGPLCSRPSPRGRCAQFAGWGTAHIGTGPCRHHQTAEEQREDAALVVRRVEEKAARQHLRIVPPLPDPLQTAARRLLLLPGGGGDVA